MNYYIYWIIIGIVAGFIASRIVNRHGEGLILDLFIGILGAFIGGWLFSKMGIHVPGPGPLGSMVTATVGAILLLLVVRLFR